MLKGDPLLFECPTHRRPLRHLGPQSLPGDHRLLHLPAHPPHRHQPHVVLRHDQPERLLCRHLQHRLRLRRRRHRRLEQIDGVRPRLRHIRRQPHHVARARLLPHPLLQRELRDRAGHRHSRVRLDFHHGGGARVPARKGW